jgi:hypothetical protein
MNPRDQFRKGILQSLGAGGLEVNELLAYNRSIFTTADWPDQPCPLADEPFVAAWRGYADECQATGSITPLRKYLVQLNYPIQEGISARADYAAATRSGWNAGETAGLALAAPERCRVLIHPTAAGSIPIIMAAEREDFVSLVRALSLKNEPGLVPESMGACIIAGYNNWHRFRSVQANFPSFFPDEPPDLSSQEQFRRIVPRRELYQDRFIILSDGAYSGVLPVRLGLSAKAWREFSLVIRREHECTHYFTRRVLRSMRNNLFDELIADYAGIISVLGHYRADWGLLFLGLEGNRGCRPGGRFENYLGDPPLSAGAVTVLERLTRQAAANLEILDRMHCKPRNWPDVQPAFIVALSGLTLEELASDRAASLFTEALNAFAVKNEKSTEVV